MGNCICDCTELKTSEIYNLIHGNTCHSWDYRYVVIFTKRAWVGWDIRLLKMLRRGFLPTNIPKCFREFPKRKKKERKLYFVTAYYRASRMQQSWSLFYAFKHHLAGPCFLSFRGNVVVWFCCQIDPSFRFNLHFSKIQLPFKWECN